MYRIIICSAISYVHHKYYHHNCLTVNLLLQGRYTFMSHFKSKYQAKEPIYIWKQSKQANIFFFSCGPVTSPHDRFSPLGCMCAWGMKVGVSQQEISGSNSHPLHPWAACHHPPAATPVHLLPGQRGVPYLHLWHWGRSTWQAGGHDRRKDKDWPGPGAGSHWGSRLERPSLAPRSRTARHNELCPGSVGPRHKGRQQSS